MMPNRRLTNRSAHAECSMVGSCKGRSKIVQSEGNASWRGSAVRRFELSYLDKPNDAQGLVTPVVVLETNICMH
jgi:hypothetical protein